MVSPAPKPAGGNRQVLQDSACRADRRRGVGVVMGVDADDEAKIWMESQHAVRSLAERTSIPARASCGKTVMSHTGGGQASDQANTTTGSGAGSTDGQVPLRAPSAGPISFWVTSLLPAPVSDHASRNRWIQIHSQVLTCRRHYFCAPGIDRAHEKGGVEGEIGRFRRRHLNPIPQTRHLHRAFTSRARNIMCGRAAAVAPVM